MGVFRDRINAKLRSRRGKTYDDSDTRTDASTLPPSPRESIEPPATLAPIPNSPSHPPPTLPTPPTTTTTATLTHSSLPQRRKLPLQLFSSTASTSTTSSTNSVQDVSTKFRRLLRTTRTTRTSHTSTTSSPVDDVPAPTPTLLPSHPTHPDLPDTALTDGYVSLILPPHWHAVRATDGVYLLSGQGVAFVKAVHALQACEVLLQVARLSVMAEVLVRSTPVWQGREATVDYYLNGGFGIGVARFEQHFDAAVVFGVCGPNENAALVRDAVEWIRRNAKVVRLPECEQPERDVEDEAKDPHNAKDQNGKNGNGKQEECQTSCVVQ